MGGGGGFFGMGGGKDAELKAESVGAALRCCMPAAVGFREAFRQKGGAQELYAWEPLAPEGCVPLQHT